MFFSPFAVPGSMPTFCFALLNLKEPVASFAAVLLHLSTLARTAIDRRLTETFASPLLPAQSHYTS
jgi:hypothetical protein